MASYVVMEPPETHSDAALVRDGFYFFAFPVPVLWFLWHRMWLEAGIAFIAAIVIGLMPGLSPLSFPLALLVGLYVGLDAAALRISALRRRGWREWGVVEAANRIEAETRYFTELPEPLPADDRWPQSYGGPWDGRTTGTRAARPGSLDLIGVTDRR